MNSILKYLIAMMLVSMPAAYCPGQEIEKEEIQEAVEAVEEIADEIGEQVEEIGEAIEKWMEENSDEIEEWVEQHGDSWEEWAEEFEEKMSRWAAGQERVWERWAKRYTDRWEGWSSRLESDEIDSDELGKIIEGNIKMLSDIPLGQLIDGALKEGLSHLEDAPWESIDGLQSMIRRSIEQSVEMAEEEIANAGERIDRAAREMAAKQRRNDGRRGEDEDVDFILPVVEKLQNSMDSKREAVESKSDDKMKELQQLLKNKNADWEDVEAIIREMRKIKKERMDLEKKSLLDAYEAAKKQKRESAQKRNGEFKQARELARKQAIENARQAAEARLKKRSVDGQSRKAEDREQIAKKLAEKAEVRQKRLEQLIRRFEETQEENRSSRDSLKKIYEQLAKEEKKIDSKDAMIEQLKDQIKDLSKEIKSLKKDK